MINFNGLVTGFKEIGLKAGDTVLVHSSYKSFGGVEGGPQVVTEALLDVLTPEGTLIMPAFSFDFNKGKPWDVRSSQSQMGIITELARNDPRFKRVFHPTYSFSIAGKHADELTSVRYTSSYERISVFGRLRDLDGKIMVIGLTYNNSMTFFHHIEQMEGVDYRYIKYFTGEVTDENGKTWVDTFDMLVRDIEKGVHTMVDPMGSLLEQRGVIQSLKIGEADVKLMRATQVYAVTAVEMRKNPNLLYYIEKNEA